MSDDLHKRVSRRLAAFLSNSKSADRLAAEVIQMCAAIEATRIEKLQAALLEYGAHKHWCKKWTDPERMECECGWLKRRRALELIRLNTEGSDNG
jgi:hypothetical protein